MNHQLESEECGGALLWKAIEDGPGLCAMEGARINLSVLYYMSIPRVSGLLQLRSWIWNAMSDGLAAIAHHGVTHRVLWTLRRYLRCCLEDPSPQRRSPEVYTQLSLS